MSWKKWERTMKHGEIVMMDPHEIGYDPDLTPKHDETMIVLMEQAIKGELPLYSGKVPLGLIVPFDLDYRPDTHPIGKQMIDLAFKEGSEGKLYSIIVYPRGIWFVSSDDYPYLFAAIRGRPDYVPCWILGKPDSPFVKDLRGPIAVDEVPRAFGLA